MKLNTVNIIEIANGDVQRLTSFKDNKEGNIDAENLFGLLVVEHNSPVQDHTEPYNEEDIKAMIEDGSYHDEYGYYLVIVHSI